jgi:hypothetical protein
MPGIMAVHCEITERFLASLLEEASAKPAKSSGVKLTSLL